MSKNSSELQTSPDTIAAISAVLTPKNIKSVLRKLLRIAKGLASEKIYIKGYKCPHCKLPIPAQEIFASHDSMIKASKVLKDFSDKLAPDSTAPKQKEDKGKDKPDLGKMLTEIAERKLKEKNKVPTAAGTEVQ